MRKIFLTGACLFFVIAGNLNSQQSADSTKTEKVTKPKSFPVSALSSMQLSGYVQGRYQINDNPGSMNGFDARRAYVDLRGNLSSQWGYRLQVDFATSPKIMDVYGEYKLNPYLNFMLGQFLLPFSLNNITSNTKLELIDRSQVVEALVARGEDIIGNQNGRDIGLQVGGSLLKIGEKSLIDYKVGIFNGVGINVKKDLNEAKDIVGRILINPLNGLSIGGSYYNGLANIETTDTTTENQKRIRTGFEASYTLGQLSLSGEYIFGSDGAADRNGYYAQAGYFIFPKKLQVIAKYDFYDSDTSADNDVSTWIVGGINYFFSSKIFLQVNYTFKQEESNSYNNDFTAFQLTVGF